MFDLTHATWRPNRYGGSEKKRTLLFDGKIYMVKFPEPPRSKKVFVRTAVAFWSSVRLGITIREATRHILQHLRMFTKSLSVSIFP